MKNVRALVYVSILGFILTACSGEQKDSHQHDHTSEAVEKVTYTCPMHPEVVQSSPGKCPICGMDLVKKNATQQLMLNETEIKLANITTQKVTFRPMGQTIVANGKLVVNEERTEIVSSRAAGRVEKLFVKETGRKVKKGDPLYALYSEELLTLQREYLLASDQFQLLGNTEPHYESFFKAAERKLLLYGLSKNQLEQLTKSRQIQDRILFLAPAGGIVTQITVEQGQYINEGTSLYRLEDFSQLWVEAELYPSEESVVKVGDIAQVKVTGIEAIPVDAVVTFISRQYRSSSQITLVRGAIQNPEGIFKPGMQVDLYITHHAHQSLTVPVDAVIRSSRGNHVYVQSGAHTFHPQSVKIGMEDFAQVEIVDGLKENDTVVVSGAYLLYSELVLKKGVEPGDVHQH